MSSSRSRFFDTRSSGSDDESSDEAPVIVQKPATAVASRLVTKYVILNIT